LEIIEEVIEWQENIDFTFKSSIPYQKADPGNESVDIGYGKSKEKRSVWFR